MVQDCKTVWKTMDLSGFWTSMAIDSDNTDTNDLMYLFWNIINSCILHLCSFLSIFLKVVLQIFRWSSAILLLLILYDKWKKNQNSNRRRSSIGNAAKVREKSKVKRQEAAVKLRGKLAMLKSHTFSKGGTHMSGRHKLMSMKEMLHSDKKLNEDVATELAAFLECIVNNYINTWWTAFTDNTHFTDAVKVAMVESFGELAVCFGDRVQVMNFLMDKLPDTLIRHLRYYSICEKKAAFANPGAFGFTSSQVHTEDLQQLRSGAATPREIRLRNMLVVEEFRKEGCLHAALAGGDSQSLELKDLYDAERLQQSQMIYIRGLAKFLTNKLLPDELKSATVSRTFAEEMMSCVGFRSTIVRLMIPYRINMWILKALDISRKGALRAARKKKHLDADASSESKEPSSNTEGKEAKSKLAKPLDSKDNHKPKLGWFPPGMAPPGSGMGKDDTGWVFFAGEKTKEEANQLLLGKEGGTFLIYRPKNRKEPEDFTLAVLQRLPSIPKRFTGGRNSTELMGTCEQIGEPPVSDTWDLDGRKSEMPWHVRLYCAPEAFQCMEQQIMKETTVCPTLMDLLSSFQGNLKPKLARGVKFTGSLSDEVASFPYDADVTQFLEEDVSAVSSPLHESSPSKTTEESRIAFPSENSEQVQLVEAEVEDVRPSMANIHAFHSEKPRHVQIAKDQDLKKKYNSLSQEDFKRELQIAHSQPQTNGKHDQVQKNPRAPIKRGKSVIMTTVSELVTEIYSTLLESTQPSPSVFLAHKLPAAKEKTDGPEDFDLNEHFENEERNVLLMNFELAIQQVEDVVRSAQDGINCWSKPSGIHAVSRCIKAMQDILRHGIRSQVDKQLVEEILQEKAGDVDDSSTKTYHQLLTENAISFAELDGLLESKRFRTPSLRGSENRLRRKMFNSDENITEFEGTPSGRATRYHSRSPVTSPRNLKSSLPPTSPPLRMRKSHSEEEFLSHDSRDKETDLEHLSYSGYLFMLHRRDIVMRNLIKRTKVLQTDNHKNKQESKESFDKKVQDLLGFAWLCAQIENQTIHSSLCALFSDKANTSLHYSKTSIPCNGEQAQRFLRGIEQVTKKLRLQLKTKGALQQQLSEKGFDQFTEEKHLIKNINSKAPPEVSHNQDKVLTGKTRKCTMFRPNRDLAQSARKREKYACQFQDQNKKVTLESCITEHFRKCKEYTKDLSSEDSEVPLEFCMKRNHDALSTKKERQPTMLSPAFVHTALKLKYLLLNRPHPAYLKARRLSFNPRSRIKAHVVKAQTADVISEDGVHKVVVLFYIRVHYNSCESVEHYSDSSIFFKCEDCKDKSWTICRRFSDFDTFNYHLQQQISYSAAARFMPVLPSKRGVFKLYDDDSFIETRRAQLDEYLVGMVCSGVLNQCSELYIFLGNYNEQSDREDNVSQLMPLKMQKDQPHQQAAEIRQEDDSSHKPGPAENDSTLSNHETDERGIPKLKTEQLHEIEMTLLDLVKEIFDYDELDFVHRNFVGMTSTIVPMMFSNTILNFLSMQYMKLGSSSCAAKTIAFVRNIIWPGGKRPPPSSDPWPNPVDVQQDVQAKLLAWIPGGLQTLFGERPCERAVLKFFGFLQDEILLKNFIWSLVDLLLVDLYPEISEEVDAIKLLHEKLNFH